MRDAAVPPRACPFLFPFPFPFPGPDPGTGTDPAEPDPGPDSAEAAALSALWAGYEDSLAPHLDTPHPSGVAVTRPASTWHTMRCTTCGQTFRRGDIVRVDPYSGTVVHLDPALRCVSPAPGNPTRPGGSPPGQLGTDMAEQADLLAEFSAGLLETCPPPGHAPIIRLQPLDRLVAQPGPPTAPTCLYCGHTFRGGEYVVVCPCGRRRGTCTAAVHRDPVAGLPCWDSWRPDGKLAWCPVTLEPVEHVVGEHVVGAEGAAEPDRRL